ncbi:MAG: 50S ribosomal protein L44e [Candidatus Methanofastidiosia archaeon]
MKISKKRNTYCPKCKKHTSHTLKLVKKKKRGELKQGQRRFRRKLKGYRGYPRSRPHGEKPTKRFDLRYKCSVCGKSSTKRGFRAKRLEFE